MEGSGKYYLISHLVLLTGLTDRTIRKYISSGILQGEKIDGLWHFTPGGLCPSPGGASQYSGQTSRRRI